MASGNLISLQVPKFSKEKFDNWCIQMKAILGAHDVWEIVENGYDASQDISALTQAQKDQFNSIKKKDQKAVSLIHQALDEVTFEKVSNATIAKQLWQKLQAAYKGKEKAKKMRRLDEEVTDLRIIEKILRSVIEKFDYVVTAIEESKGLEDMTVEELSGSLEAHEEKLNRRKKEPVEFGNNVKANFSQDEDKEVNEKVETTLLLACKEMKNEDKHSWYLDTGASNHMCGNNKEVNTILDLRLWLAEEW
ncbi:hypothetical protein SLEP1_g34136 [Rubroshorea leprosula]|uniref:DUF4219 domain-containing protein n=1 Tax=Rubroshorea leprosula TaxID=152421 RepID=A0AAV5KIW7_9ROSI|nr:hypothetical protein SLEP1_g34136 [Rubroshorea leprosula]